MLIITDKTQPKIAYLDYDYEGKRGGNIGGELIYKLCSHRDIQRCDAASINNYDIVLVSIPSTSQVVDIYNLARKHNFAARKCKIIVGGFGCQNINLLIPFIDYACFGRFHDVIDDVIDGVIDGGVADIVQDHMLSANDLHSVSFRQAPLMTGAFDEEFTGCPLKCKFCHYTYARKFNGKTNGYVQALLSDGNADEILYQDLLAITEKKGRIRTAIDGFSERIRYLYGKRISNQLIIDGINHLGDIAQDKNMGDFFGGHENNRKTVMTVYNIANFPYETAQDEQELHDTIMQANPKTRVIFILHSTPFRASPATPMQWERVQLLPDWSAKREQMICDRPNLYAKYSYTLEGPWSQLMAALVERSKVGDDIVDRALAHGKSMKALDRMQSFCDANDVNYYIGEHDIDKQAPGAWYLSSYLGDDKLRKIAHKMRRQRSEWI